MKQTFTLSIFCVVMSSCGAAEQIENERTYREVEHLKITAKEVFLPAKTRYFVYFYRTHCSHCNEIKSRVIDYALSSIEDDFFFLEDSEEVKKDVNPYVSIGVSDVNEIAISGVPTLMEILEHMMSAIYYGVKEIESFFLLNS